MEQKLSDTLVRQIDTHDPFMQIHKIGQKYNDLIDRYNALEAELDKLKNPPADEEQQTDIQNNDEIPADNDGILNDTATDNQNTDGSDTPATDGTDNEETDDEKSEDEK